MVIESPVFMVTGANVVLASIPFLLAVVELNRPDSVTAPILPPAAVKVRQLIPLHWSGLQKCTQDW